MKLNNYMNTFFGYKQTMTQTWDQIGHRFPVTVVSVPTLVVTQLKTSEGDGYKAAQVGIGQTHKHSTKPEAQHLKKAAVTSTPQQLKEIRLKEDDAYELGQTIPVSTILKVGDYVTVSGTSKGRGFAGVIKRWGFSGGPRTHGQSDRERAPGSIGQGTSPGRIHKGKKMAGRYGNQRFSIRNLQILNIDESAGTLWVSGPIPGPKNALVTIVKTAEGKFNFPAPTNPEPEKEDKPTAV